MLQSPAAPQAPRKLPPACMHSCTALVATGPYCYRPCCCRPVLPPGILAMSMPLFPRALLQDLAHDQLESGRPLRLEEMEPFQAPLAVLGAAGGHFYSAAHPTPFVGRQGCSSMQPGCLQAWGIQRQQTSGGRPSHRPVLACRRLWPGARLSLLLHPPPRRHRPAAGAAACPCAPPGPAKRPACHAGQSMLMHVRRHWAGAAPGEPHCACRALRKA